MSRKFIKIATAAIILFAFTAVPLQADDSLAAAAGIELSTLETISGNVFRDVELITADENGLLFRHSKGTAKVDFTDLNYNLREMFEPEPAPVADVSGGKGDDIVADEGGYESLEIVTRTRILITWPQYQSNCASHCNPFDPRNVNWRFHWGRYHYGLSYANFHCRQAAERDLLIRSGFLR
ncbi:MAG: hypothetical protein ACKVJU_18205 [Verrucomicrobiales bacterium]